MFYEKYARLCAERGLSVTGVARKLHITPNAPSAWANGATPRNSTLKRIADYFNVDVSYFYENDEIESKDDKLVENFISEMKRDLTDDEHLLLDMFRTMNDEQKNDLLKEAMRIKMR